jgi:hypothetical protein
MMLMCYETKQGNHATFVELQQKKNGDLVMAFFINK